MNLSREKEPEGVEVVVPSSPRTCHQGQAGGRVGLVMINGVCQNKVLRKLVTTLISDILRTEHPLENGGSEIKKIRQRGVQDTGDLKSQTVTVLEDTRVGEESCQESGRVRFDLTPTADSYDGGDDERIHHHHNRRGQRILFRTSTRSTGERTRGDDESLVRSRGEKIQVGRRGNFRIQQSIDIWRHSNQDALHFRIERPVSYTSNTVKIFLSPITGGLVLVLTIKVISHEILRPRTRSPSPKSGQSD